MRKFTVLLTILFGLNSAHGLDNGLALTPPMGWMHWERFRCLVDCDRYPDDCISEQLFRTVADRMVEDGYLDAGYEYIIIDDCWAAFERDNNNRLQPNPDRFPSGIKNLSDYIHDKGLKFGIYGDYGTKTCAGYPGSKDHLELDANTFAEWGVDYLKLDGCAIDYRTIETGYLEMERHLNKTGRPIVFSCSWPDYQEEEGMKANYSLVAKTCNLWRNWKDIEDEWASVKGIVEWFAGNQDRLAPFAGPGHWNDPDMLIIGNYGLSYEQSKAQMAIWAVMAAPLIMSVDLRTIEPKFRDILLNKKIIAVNQDPLGIQGRLVVTKNKIDIWTRPVLPKGEDTSSFAIAMLSRRVDGYPYRLNFTLTELGIKSSQGFILQDLYNPSVPLKKLSDTDIIVVRVKPSGGEILLVSPRSSATATTVEQI